MAGFAGMKTSTSGMRIWIIERALQDFGRSSSRRWCKRTEKGARQGTDQRTACPPLSKLTEVVDGETRIVAEPPLIVPSKDLAEGAEREECSRLWANLLSVYPRHARA